MTATEGHSHLGFNGDHTMNKIQDKSDETFNQFKVMDSVKIMTIIEGAVDAVLNNLNEIEVAKKAAEVGNKAVTKAANGQLNALKTALSDYTEIVTQDVWDKLFRANVSERLSTAKIDGSQRYANRGSRDVMVNLIKVATMGLTLAKHDKAFEPSPRAQTNLKKYAEEVRPKLQEAIDPATGEPRLRSLAPKPPKKLKGDTYYWLIGCEHADKGISGANTVIGADYDLVRLEQVARGFAVKYESFLYCEAKMTPMALNKEEKFDDIPIQNAAVFAEVISLSTGVKA
jgi:hypothetical protein